jgi:TetR/AcrR family acrAB operon transcriptional repressor
MVRRTAQAAAATRHDLLEAALVTFAEYGYDAATLEGIAARASVTRGAVYHHFTDKADLYDAVLREQANQVMRPLLASLAASGPPLQRLRRFVLAYCAALERDPRFRAVLELLLFGGGSVPSEAREKTRVGFGSWLEAFEGVLTEAHERGQLRPGVSPRAAALTVVALTVGVTTTALDAPDLASPAEAAPSLVDALLGGIAASAVASRSCGSTMGESEPARGGTDTP